MTDFIIRVFLNWKKSLKQKYDRFDDKYKSIGYDLYCHGIGYRRRSIWSYYRKETLSRERSSTVDDQFIRSIPAVFLIFRRIGSTLSTQPGYCPSRSQAWKHLVGLQRRWCVHQNHWFWFSETYWSEWIKNILWNSSIFCSWSMHSVDQLKWLGPQTTRFGLRNGTIWQASCISSWRNEERVGYVVCWCHPLLYVEWKASLWSRWFVSRSASCFIFLQRTHLGYHLSECKSIERDKKSKDNRIWLSDCWMWIQQQESPSIKHFIIHGLPIWYIE